MPLWPTGAGQGRLVNILPDYAKAMSEYPTKRLKTSRTAQ